MAWTAEDTKAMFRHTKNLCIGTLFEDDGVVYRVTDPKLAILMFRSGRAVCTGGKDEDNIHTGIDRMIGDMLGKGKAFFTSLGGKVMVGSEKPDLFS